MEPGDWKETEFQELLVDRSISYGVVQPGSHTEQNCVPIIRVNNIRNGVIETNDVMKISAEIESKYRRTRLEGGELLITVVGSVGECAIVPDSLKGWNVARAVSVARISKSADVRFVRYSFKSEDIIFQMYGGTNDTVQPTLNLSSLKTLKLKMPSLPEQRAIAGVLSSLDDKIDLLHRQNKTLEDMAETLFRHWFVEEANDDWEDGTLGEVIEIFDGKRIPLSKMERDKCKEGTLYPYYGAAKIMDYVNDYIFDGEYILMGEDGTVRTEDGLPILQFATGKFWVNNHAHVLKAKPPYNDFFLWKYLSRTNIDEIVTGAVQPKINQGNLKALPFPRFPPELVLKFNSITVPLRQRIHQNGESVRTLEKLRDSLLPKLMSGDVRVQYE